MSSAGTDIKRLDFMRADAWSMEGQGDNGGELKALEGIRGGSMLAGWQSQGSRRLLGGSCKFPSCKEFATTCAEPKQGARLALCKMSQSGFGCEISAHRLRASVAEPSLPALNLEGRKESKDCWCVSSPSNFPGKQLS